MMGIHILNNISINYINLINSKVRNVYKNTYPALMKNPPKSIIGIKRGAARANAISKEFAKHETKYPAKLYNFDIRLIKPEYFSYGYNFSHKHIKTELIDFNNIKIFLIFNNRARERHLMDQF